MNKKNKKEINVIKFPRNISKLERQVEAILFAAEEPLDIETIEKRVQSTSNIKKILENIQSDYKNRGINLICIKEKQWPERIVVSMETEQLLMKKQGK